MREAILSLVPRSGSGVEVSHVCRGLRGLGHIAKPSDVEARLKQLAEERRVYRIGAYWWGR